MSTRLDAAYAWSAACSCAEGNDHAARVRRSWRKTNRSCCGGRSWASWGRKVEQGSSSCSAQSRLTRKKQPSQLTFGAERRPLVAGAIAPRLFDFAPNSSPVGFALDGTRRSNHTLGEGVMGFAQMPEKTAWYPQPPAVASLSCDYPPAKPAVSGVRLASRVIMLATWRSCSPAPAGSSARRCCRSCCATATPCAR